jgi:hypothetical protein
MKSNFTFAFLCISFSLTATVSIAQSNFWKNVSVRKAFETKTEDDRKPAIISLTLPKDTSNSFLVNAGIGYDFFQSDKTNTAINTITGFFVYNRNTLVDKTTKNYKSGLTGAHVFYLNDRPLTGILGATTLQYLHNYIDTTHSFIVTTYWHPVYKSDKFIHIGGYMATPHVVDYFFLPQAGLEYQKFFEANSKRRQGFDTRLYFNGTLNIRIKKKTRFTTDEIKQNKTDSLYTLDEWKKKSFEEVINFVDNLVPEGTTEVMSKKNWTSLFIFSFSYTGRQSFWNETSNFEAYIPFFSAGVNFYPLYTENFSLGLSYNDGANPIDGIPKQTYWLLSLNFKK